MAVYADYTYYSNTFKGNAIASEDDFNKLILRSSAYIDRITAGGAASTSPADPVKMAACAVAEAWQINEQGGELASQSVGSWSRTYSTKAKSADARLYEAAALYIDDLLAAARWL